MPDFLGPQAVTTVGIVIATAMSAIMLTLSARVWREWRQPKKADAITAKRD